MAELKNDRFLRALLRQPVDVTPVWMMRQAGRYLPEYRETRSKAGDFMTLCSTPELACEVTLQPLERFPLDAAILFSDILTIPDAMGLGLYFETGEGPKFKNPVRSESDIDALKTPDPEQLIGFAGSPWTISTYMVEGGSSKGFDVIKQMMFDQPATLHRLLDTVANSVINYLNAQVAAGAQAIMIFDTWGGVLTPRDYREFSLRYMQKIVDGLTREADGRVVPVILFTKNGGQWLETMADTGCDALGIDWTTNMGEARARVGDRVSLQGNMDPCVLYASPDRIREEVADILKSYGDGSGMVFNLGHGIHPQVDPEHAAAFIDAVHELSTDYHKR
jgi:uroporphyrinogen decarboxylase